MVITNIEMITQYIQDKTRSTHMHKQYFIFYLTKIYLTDVVKIYLKDKYKYKMYIFVFYLQLSLGKYCFGEFLKMMRYQGKYCFGEFLKMMRYQGKYCFGDFLKIMQY
jgi:hypothetical protein